MNLTEKQKKLIVYALIALLPLSYLYRHVVTWANQREYRRQMAIRQAIQRTQQAQRQEKPAPVMPVAGKKALGLWRGSAYLLPPRGMCILDLTVKPGDDPESFTAYSRLKCPPPTTRLTYRSPDLDKTISIMAALNPVSAILTGKPEGKSLSFTVDRIIGSGVTTTACPPSSLVLTPFANNQLAAEFKDPCGGGQMILARATQ